METNAIFLFWPCKRLTEISCLAIVTYSCMLDSKRDPGASQFMSRTDKTLRFSLKAFQFTSDPEMEVSITSLDFFLFFHKLNCGFTLFPF